MVASGAAPVPTGGQVTVSWLDLVVVALCGLAALHGWRTGAVVQVVTYTGLFLGLLLGVLLARPVAGLVAPASRPWLALLVLVAVATAVTAGASLAAPWLREAARRVHLGPADEGVGVAVAVVAVLVAVWLVGSFLASSRFAAVNQAARRSAVLRGLTAVLPSVPSVFASIDSFLTSSGFPVVFVDLPPEVVPPSGVPSEADVAAAVAAARASTVEVTGLACGSIVSGSGFVAAPDLVVTNAHVVAGEARSDVIDAAGRHAATTVWYDPGRDVAVLRVPGLDDPVLRLAATTVPSGTAAAVLGYPGGGAFQSSPATVGATFNAIGLDIYGTSTVTRQVYELRATVVPGDSGGPVVAAGSSSSGLTAGTVVGVVFSRSTAVAGIGYALTTPEIAPDLRAAEASTAAVGTGACVP